MSFLPQEQSQILYNFNGSDRQKEFQQIEKNRVLSASRSLEDLSTFKLRNYHFEEQELLRITKGDSSMVIQIDGMAGESQFDSSFRKSDENKETLEYSPGSNLGGIKAERLIVSDQIRSEIEAEEKNESQKENEKIPSVNILQFLQEKLKQQQIEVQIPHPSQFQNRNEKQEVVDPPQMRVREYLRYKKTKANSQIGKKKSEGEENQWKIFAKMRKVRQFCKFLLEQKYYSNFKNLSQLNLEAINDFSHLELIKHPIEDFLSRFKVIEPLTVFELTWNIIMFIVLLQQYLIIPFEFCFEINLTTSTKWFIVNYFLPSTVLIIDLFLNFNVAYYDKGNLITNHFSIFQNYLKTNFWMNLFTTASFVFQQYTSIFQILFLMRVPQIPSLLGKIDEHFQLQQRFNTQFELSKLLMLIFGCAHFVACGFHLVATLVEQTGDQTWIQKQNLDEESKEMRYLQSIYFSFITMVTVGYGDITPVSWQEKAYVIVVIIFSCGMFGYSMNTIGAIFQEISKREAAFKQVKFDMGEYMRSRDIPKLLQTKVLKNLEYSNILNGDQGQKGEAIMNTLTLTLRNQIKREFYGRILSMYKLFNLNFSQEVRQEICLHMKEIILQPGEIIYDSGQSNDRIYFLHKGSVELGMLNQTKQNLSIIGLAPVNYFIFQHFCFIILKSGSMLGQFGFFTNTPEILQARCFDTCYLLYCDRNNFLQVLSKYQYDLEVFCKLRDNLLVYNRQFDTTCFSCQKIGHETSKCQFYNTKILNYICIGRHLKSFPQNRDSNKSRTLRKNLNSLSTRWQNMVQGRTIRLNYFYQAQDKDAPFEFVTQEELELETTDMDFMLFIPKIRFKEEQFEYSEGEISYFSETQYDQEKKENDLFQKNGSDSNFEIVRRSYKDMTSHKMIDKLKSIYFKEDSNDPDPSNMSEMKQFSKKQAQIFNKKYSSSSNKLDKKNYSNPSSGSLQLSQVNKGIKKESPLTNSSSKHYNRHFTLKSSKQEKKGHQQKVTVRQKSNGSHSLKNLDKSFSGDEIHFKTDETMPLPSPNMTESKLKLRSPFKQDMQLPVINEINSNFKPPFLTKRSFEYGKDISHSAQIQLQSRGSVSQLPVLSLDLKEGINITNIEFGQQQTLTSKIKRKSILASFAEFSILKNGRRNSSKRISEKSSRSTISNQYQENTLILEDENPVTQEKSQNEKLIQVFKTKEGIQFSSQNHNEDQISSLSCFDIQKEYKGYYPNNNVTRVLSVWKTKFLKLFFKKTKQRTRLNKSGGDFKRSAKKHCSIKMKGMLTPMNDELE